MFVRRKKKHNKTKKSFLLCLINAEKRLHDKSKAHARLDTSFLLPWIPCSTSHTSEETRFILASASREIHTGLFVHESKQNTVPEIKTKGVQRRKEKTKTLNRDRQKTKKQKTLSRAKKLKIQYTQQLLRLGLFHSYSLVYGEQLNTLVVVKNHRANLKLESGISKPNEKPQSSSIK